MEYRNYLIITDPDYLMKMIKAIGRGSVHLSLRGYYQTIRDAQKAIDAYENGKEIVSDETSIRRRS